MTYKKRYNDTQFQNAYMNACDCLYYGFGRDFWNRCGLSDDDACKVWKCAKNDLGRE